MSLSVLGNTTRGHHRHRCRFGHTLREQLLAPLPGDWRSAEGEPQQIHARITSRTGYLISWTGRLRIVEAPAAHNSHRFPWSRRKDVSIILGAYGMRQAILLHANSEPQLSRMSLKLELGPRHMMIYASPIHPRVARFTQCLGVSTFLSLIYSSIMQIKPLPFLAALALLSTPQLVFRRFVPPSNSSSRCFSSSRRCLSILGPIDDTLTH
jgi:hypothetical protein